MTLKKLIIFDCDGVLVDSELIVGRFLVEYLKKFHYEISVEEWIKRFLGQTVEKIYAEINVEFTNPPFTQNAIKLIQEQLYKHLYENLLAIEGIKDLLERLQKIGQPFCVASSGTTEKILRSLRVTGLKKYFPDEHIFSAQLVKHGKPSPDIFLLAAKKMAFEPQSCLVIEDSISGIKAAQSAGMSVVAFLGGSHAKYDWYIKNIESYAVPIVDDVDELLNYLNDQI